MKENRHSEESKTVEQEKAIAHMGRTVFTAKKPIVLPRIFQAILSQRDFSSEAPSLRTAK